MTLKLLGVAVAGALMFGFAMATPASAAAPSSATSAARLAVVPLAGVTQGPEVEEVQYRHRRYYRGPRYRRHHRRYYHRAPAYRGYGAAHVRWCHNRYRSYRQWDNTYQPYNGPRRQCVSPY